MAVIAAVELDNFVASGESARQSNARHCCFGAAVDHSDLFDRRHPSADQFGQFHLEWIWNSKTQSARSGVAHSIDNHFRCVAKNRRTPTPDVVEIFLSIDIPNFRSGSALGEKMLAADIAERAHRRIDASRNAPLGCGK